MEQSTGWVLQSNTSLILSTAFAKLYASWLKNHFFQVIKSPCLCCHTLDGLFSCGMSVRHDWLSKMCQRTLMDSLPSLDMHVGMRLCQEWVSNNIKVLAREKKYFLGDIGSVS